MFFSKAAPDLKYNLNCALVKLCSLQVHEVKSHTDNTEVVILVPPEAPLIMTISPCSLNTMVGVMDESGLFPGTIKFAGDGGTPNEFSMPGVEKSSISLLKIIPVLLPRHLDPKLKFVENSDYRNYSVFINRHFKHLVQQFHILQRHFKFHNILQTFGMDCIFRPSFGKNSPNAKDFKQRMALLPPANKVCEDYVFTGVCLSTGGCAWWQGDMHGGGGACVVAGGAWWQGEGACVVAGGHAWWWGACVVTGGHAWWWGCMGYDEIRSMSGQYASYWNAFLFTRGWQWLWSPRQIHLVPAPIHALFPRLTNRSHTRGHSTIDCTSGCRLSNCVCTVCIHPTSCSQLTEWERVKFWNNKRRRSKNVSRWLQHDICKQVSGVIYCCRLK